MACWFCSVRIPEANHVLELDMYGDVDALKTPAQTTVAYNVRHIDIPRCADCHKRHSMARNVRFLAALLAITLIGAALSIAFSWVPPLYAGLWAGLSAGLMAGALVSGALVQKGIYSVGKSRAQYPEVKELLGKNYRFGLRPKNRVAESGQPSGKPVPPVKKS
jgi:hypothetical protein